MKERDRNVVPADVSACNFARDKPILELKVLRRRFRTAELTDDEADQIASARMDARHAYLNELLDPKH